MQNETQILGQHAQAANILVQTKASSSWRKPWHSDHDLNLRREIFSQITKFVQKYGLDSKLPAIAKELESALYVDAETKDEYGNLMTLEHRICSLMLRWRNRQKVVQQASLAGPQLAETGSSQTGFTSISVYPGSKIGLQSTVAGRHFSSHGGPRAHLNTGGACVPSAYNSNSMGVFSNNGLTTSLGQVPSTSFSGVDVLKSEVTSNIGMPRVGSMMIPTPGLSINNGASTGRPTFVRTNDGSLEKMRQHMLSVGLIGQPNGGLNFQRGSIYANNNDLGNLGITTGVQAPEPSQTFINRPIYSSTLYHSNVNQNMNQVFPHHSNPLNPSLPHHRTYGASGEDASVVTGVTPQSNFTTSGTSLSSIRSFDQPNAGFSQHIDSQHNTSHIGASPNSPVFSVVSQEQNQQLGNCVVIINDQESYGVNSVNGDAQPLVRSPIDQNVLVDIISSENPKYQTNGDQVCFLEQLQSEHFFEDAGNIYVKNDVENETIMHSEQQKIQKQSQQVFSVEQQSEQTCQATSADTGQSEVVSNDDSLPSVPVKEVNFTEQIKRSQWLLVLFRHVNHCQSSEQCSISVCTAGRELWKHVTTCQSHPCANHRCTYLKLLLNHHRKCRNSKCVICGPVRLSIARKRVVRSPTKHYQNRSVRITDVESLCTKKAKMEAFSACAVPAVLQCTVSIADGIGCTAQDSFSNMKDECIESSSAIEMNEVRDENVGLDSGKLESPIQSLISAATQSQENTKDTSVEEMKEVDCETHDVEPEGETGKAETDANLSTITPETVMPPLKPSSSHMKPLKKKISGITYIERLSPEQIRQHIASLRKWIGQSKGKAEKNQAMEHQMSASACSACAVENLSFEPIPIFCTQCGCRIKRNAIYHSFGSGDNSLNFCSPCFNSIRSDIVETDGLKIQKSMLEKKKNDEQRVEGWVECDKCKKWQHQICVLFNARMNKERSEYICPECCIDEMERGERVPLPPNSVLGAKDLPRTFLSDFVEERLSWKLEHERAERAKVFGKSLEEVPSADGLVVRVISSVDKKLEVKPKFLELFQQEEYPKDFLYKSKMLMLFQKIEGVEVCLFGMYVQEFGADTPNPNRRHVYLSYLDSVKYFRPDVKTVSGEALRTYVYHEILIAYLDYCKKRGFSSCYIWACPPLKGDDYILYCHPEIQKTPKTDKLREWYLSMIAKAKKENIVITNKNLYDYFFTSNGECKARITATRLPYFDGDYWPGAAEDILQQLQEEEEGIYTLRKGKTKKLASKRTTKTSAQAEVGGVISKDIQLMQKLGQSIAAMKEDFIMVHLHHACSRCRDFITSGHRWFCHVCGDQFQLCSCCYEEHTKLNEEERHPFGKRETHVLIMEEVRDIPAETIDRDDIMESEYFDNRQAFLSLCQGNQYQYDTLRRAKHSSMMILYHLHNPNAPAFISSCAICHSELEAGQGWKCKSCSDFDVCNGCFSSKEVQQHPHKFVARTISPDQSAANADLRNRMLQLRMMLDVLVHASKCREPSCQFAKCRNMKDLFRHGFACTKRAAGGCSLCKRMWFLLTAHARSCKETTCSVPRCMDLRKHLRRTQLQQESRRRAAVNEMIRQRAAEAAGDR